MGSDGINNTFAQTWVTNGLKGSMKTLCYACAKMVRLFGVLCGSLDSDGRLWRKVS